MQDVQYYEATILLPEFFTGIGTYKEDPGSIKKNIVTFTKSGYAFQARIIANGLNSGTQDGQNDCGEEVIVPTISQVLDDLHSVEDLLEDFRKLAAEKVIRPDLSYDRDGYGGQWYKVRNHLTLNENELNKDPFLIVRRLRKMRELPKTIFKDRLGTIIRDDFKELLSLEKQVGKSGGTLYVQGATLREAMERADQLYEMKKRL